MKWNLLAFGIQLASGLWNSITFLDFQKANVNSWLEFLNSLIFVSWFPRLFFFLDTWFIIGKSFLVFSSLLLGSRNLFQNFQKIWLHGTTRVALDKWDAYGSFLGKLYFYGATYKTANYRSSTVNSVINLTTIFVTIRGFFLLEIWLLLFEIWPFSLEIWLFSHRNLSKKGLIFHIFY